MFTKKSLVLLSENSDNEKAVLTLENDGELITGRLRLYNFGREPEGILSLGIYSNQKVIKCGLVHISTMLYSFKTKPEIGNEFSCAVVNINGANAEPILFGSTDEKPSAQKLLEVISNEALDAKTAKEAEQVLDENHIEYDKSLKGDIDAAIDSEMAKNDQVAEVEQLYTKLSALSGKENPPKESKCENCKYKKCFFGEEEQQQKHKFFEEISTQIDKLFLDSPKEEYLENAIPSSKWVRVEFDGNGDYYILGLIFDEDKNVRYVCYGVPGIYQKQPPKNLSGFPVWFPLDKTRPESFGYWLTYQDAESGESIKAIVE